MFVLCIGVDVTADTLMDRLDNGVVLCQLAQFLQEKMSHSNNAKVLKQNQIIILGIGDFYTSFLISCLPKPARGSHHSTK